MKVLVVFEKFAASYFTNVTSFSLEEGYISVTMSDTENPIQIDNERIVAWYYLDNISDGDNNAVLNNIREALPTSGKKLMDTYDGKERKIEFYTKALEQTMRVYDALFEDYDVSLENNRPEYERIVLNANMKGLLVTATDLIAHRKNEYEKKLNEKLYNIYYPDDIRHVVVRVYNKDNKPVGYALRFFSDKYVKNETVYYHAIGGKRDET